MTQDQRPYAFAAARFELLWKVIHFPFNHRALLTPG